MEMKYTIFSPRNAQFGEEIEFSNKCYQAWFQLWSETYQKQNSNFVLTADEFARQDLASVITVNGEIAGMLFFSFINTNSLSQMKTKYVNFFNEDYFSHLKNSKLYELMTMEFLTVTPNFRSKEFGLSIGRVLINLGTLMFKQINVDAIIAIARRDINVHKMAYEIGFECAQKEIIQRNFSCDLIYYPKGKSISNIDVEIKKTVYSLFEKRLVFNSAKKYLFIDKEYSVAA